VGLIVDGAAASIGLVAFEGALDFFVTTTLPLGGMALAGVGVYPGLAQTSIDSKMPATGSTSSPGPDDTNIPGELNSPWEWEATPWSTNPSDYNQTPSWNWDSQPACHHVYYWYEIDLDGNFIEHYERID
jgi:hypothetical protein